MPSEIADAEAVRTQLSARAQAIENDVSGEVSGSSIVAFNAAQAGAKVEVGKDAYEMLKIAQDVYAETGGAYNPATGLLVDLWGFSPRHRAADYAPEKPYDRGKLFGRTA